MSVWVPFDPSVLGGLPDDLDVRYVPEPGRATDADLAEVRFYVTPYRFEPADAEVIARMPRLEVVQTQTAGVEHVRGHVPDGVVLCSGRGIHDTSTAELALTLTLASLRGLPDYVRRQDRGAWEPEWNESLADKHVLLVGYGAIGHAIERRLEPFGCRVTKVARTARDDVHALADLPRLLPDVDVVVLILPGTSETRGLVDAAFLRALPQGALLVNVARGPIVRTDDLLDALRAGHVRAALDVTDPEPLPADHPLWTTPGVLLTPHVGGLGSAMEPRAHALVRDQLVRFARNEPLLNEVTGDY